MTTFVTRTLSGAVYAIVVVGAILGGTLTTGLFTFIVLILSLSEYRDLVRIRNRTLPAIPFYLFNLSILILALFVANGLLAYKFLLFSALPIFSILLIPAVSKQIEALNHLGDYLISLLYITIPLSLLNFFDIYNETLKINVLLLSTFVIIWLNDTFAYFVGSLLGKFKLNEEISPKKTWEGSIGGFIFSMGGAILLEMLFGVMNLWEWLGFAAIIVIAGTFGDLFESTLKRRAGVKESGSLIPGHGGILDRLDSILLATPFVFIYIIFIQ